MVTVVWETWLKPGAEDEGLALTHRIWADMARFQGYISHFVLRDEDEKGHLLVGSEWTSRDAADRIRDEYSDAEPVRLITPLLAKNPESLGICRRLGHTPEVIITKFFILLHNPTLMTN